MGKVNQADGWVWIKHQKNDYVFVMMNEMIILKRTDLKGELKNISIANVDLIMARTCEQAICFLSLVHKLAKLHHEFDSFPISLCFICKTWRSSEFGDLRVKKNF